MTSKKWEDVNGIYKFRNTLLQYLDNRDYDISDYNNFSYQEVIEMCAQDQLDFIVEKKDKKKSKKKIFIKHMLSSSLPKIRDLINELYDTRKDIPSYLNVKNNDEIIFVISGKISKNLKQYKNKLFNNNKIFISFYNYKNHIYNILNHSFVPKHVKLTDEEKNELIEKYNITNMKNLPEISVYDPVAIRIGLRPGDICKIYRDSTTSIITKYYRYCC